MPNCGKLIFKDEEHTLGQIVKCMLLRDKRVRFAGYIHKHPLENILKFRVQTNGEIMPETAMKDNLLEAQKHLHKVHDKFDDAVRVFKEVNMQLD